MSYFKMEIGFPSHYWHLGKYAVSQTATSTLGCVINAMGPSSQVKILNNSMMLLFQNSWNGYKPKLLKLGSRNFNSYSSYIVHFKLTILLQLSHLNPPIK